MRSQEQGNWARRVLRLEPVWANRPGRTDFMVL